MPNLGDHRNLPMAGYSTSDKRKSINFDADIAGDAAVSNRILEALNEVCARRGGKNFHNNPRVFSPDKSSGVWLFSGQFTNKQSLQEGLDAAVNEIAGIPGRQWVVKYENDNGSVNLELSLEVRDGKPVNVHPDAPPVPA